MVNIYYKNIVKLIKSMQTYSPKSCYSNEKVNVPQVRNSNTVACHTRLSETQMDI